jgi:hypothetical protein
MNKVLRAKDVDDLVELCFFFFGSFIPPLVQISTSLILDRKDQCSTESWNNR